jgi:hypothetical protein
MNIGGGGDLSSKLHLFVKDYNKIPNVFFFCDGVFYFSKITSQFFNSTICHSKGILIMRRYFMIYGFGCLHPMVFQLVYRVRSVSRLILGIGRKSTLGDI